MRSIQRSRVILIEVLLSFNLQENANFENSSAFWLLIFSEQPWRQLFFSNEDALEPFQGFINNTTRSLFVEPTAKRHICMLRLTIGRDDLPCHPLFSQQTSAYSEWGLKDRDGSGGCVCVWGDDAVVLFWQPAASSSQSRSCMCIALSLDVSLCVL